MPHTLVVLPTYNERENLPKMLDALMALDVPGRLTVLVADDNSPDGTGQIADEYAARYPERISVLHRPGKSGLGRAYIASFEHAILNTDADYVLQMDSDFSHQPKYIPQLITEIEKGYDIVIGSRYIQGGSVDETWSLFRKLLSWFANRIYIFVLLNLPIKDATGGFRIWRIQTLIGMDLRRIQSNGYIFQTEMAYVAHKLGYTTSEIPIHFPDRREGTSKMGLKIQVEAALRVFQVRYNHHNLKPSMRLTEFSGVRA
ncbi:MAG: polyprenol monophosphomannose synthase [Phototrophicaceae bacterium]